MTGPVGPVRHGDHMNLEELREKAATAKLAGNGDAEVSHVYLDEVVEDALRSLLADTEDPDAIAKAALAVDLLDTAESEQWSRWYA